MSTASESPDFSLLDYSVTDVCMIYIYIYIYIHNKRFWIYISVRLALFDSTGFDSIRVIAVLIPLASTRLMYMGNLSKDVRSTRFFVLTAVLLIKLFRNVTVSVGNSRRFGVTYCLHLQGQAN